MTATPAEAQRCVFSGVLPDRKALRATRGHQGATGLITIDRDTGDRTNVPVSVLTVNAKRTSVIARTT